ncbi:hypothetical protein EWM64_g10295 [Hericium alpestre]|uniref:Uncharacterized protein n=1 Tax=Hericium alpestre TaxID=135208 RepID=A0A4Y9ZI77_9AGAM|nr:hypothetical protein EWM64_g10295 [Hericium alpestre]
MPSAPSPAQAPSSRWSGRRLSPGVFGPDAAQIAPTPDSGHDNYNAGGYANNAQEAQIYPFSTIATSHAYSNTRTQLDYGHQYYQTSGWSSSSYAAGGPYTHPDQIEGLSNYHTGAYEDFSPRSSLGDITTASPHSVSALPPGHRKSQLDSPSAAQTAGRFPRAGQSSKTGTSAPHSAASSSKHKPETDFESFTPENRAEMKSMSRTTRFPTMDTGKKPKDRVLSSSWSAPPAKNSGQTTALNDDTKEIEWLRGEVERLTSEAARQKTAYEEQRQQQIAHVAELEAAALRHFDQQRLLAEKDARIRELEMQVQYWQSLHSYGQSHA